MKSRLGGGGQSEYQAVFTGTVPFSSRPEVRKSQPVGQIQAGDMFCK